MKKVLLFLSLFGLLFACTPCPAQNVAPRFTQSSAGRITNGSDLPYLYKPFTDSRGYDTLIYNPSAFESIMKADSLIDSLCINLKNSYASYFNDEITIAVRERYDSNTVLKFVGISTGGGVQLADSTVRIVIPFNKIGPGPSARRFFWITFKFNGTWWQEMYRRNG